ncbi:MAG: thioredoxin family protein [Salinibacter sp.]
MRIVRFAGLAAVGALLRGLAAPAAAQMAIPPHSFQDVVDRAQSRQTPILMEVYTSWCPYCQRMQEEVYADSTVQNYLDAHFTYVRLNSDTTDGVTHQVDGRTVSTKKLASMFGARGVPTTVFLKPDGSPIAHQPGFIERPTFLTMIRFVGSGAYKSQSFQEFSGR